jgi:uncharacterized phage protein gp47/JayE
LPYNRPSLQEIIDRIDNDFSVRVDNQSTFLQKSVFKIFSRVLGGSNHLLYDYIEFCKDQLLISTADEETLERHGAEYGIFRSVGEKAVGEIIAIGTDGIIVNADTELISASGNNYKVVTAGTVVSGSVNLDIIASDYGTDYDELVGTVLTFVSPIAGLNATATVLTGGITGGVNEDEKEQFRTKILNRKRYPPHGGIANDYVTWCKQYSGNITRAWSIEEYQGIGTIGLAFIKDNDISSIFPSEAERLAVRNHLISHYDSAIGKYVGIPVTAEPGFFVVGLDPYSVNLTIKIYPNTSGVRAAINTSVSALIKYAGGPGYTITISQFYEAITAATGEEKSRIIYPTVDVTTAINQLHVMGTITFQDY